MHSLSIPKQFNGESGTGAADPEYGMGGPVNATSVLGFEGFQVGIVSGDIAHGAAISLFILPVLFILVIVMLRFIRRQEI